MSRDSNDSCFFARANALSHTGTWHAFTCKATLTGSNWKGNGIKFFNGKVKEKAGMRTPNNPKPSSLDEGGFKLPEKARRSSGYAGVYHVLLPRYTLNETLNIHL